MAHGDAREGRWRGKMRMEWVASSLALYVGTRSIQLLSADPHSSTASSRLNWHPRRFKWTRPFRWKTKSGFCACAITFRTCYTIVCNMQPSANFESRQQHLGTIFQIVYRKVCLYKTVYRKLYSYLNRTARTRSFLSLCSLPFSMAVYFSFI